MSDVLTSQQVEVGTMYDMVGVKFGTHRLLLYYITTFKIAHAIAMAARLAGRHEGVNPMFWRNFCRNADFNKKPKAHHTYRRTREVTNLKDWKVSFEGPLVVLKFDELEVKLHYTNAFELYVWMRTNGRIAKAWAGDTSKTMTVTAHLTDAEESDKFVYAT